jgi:thiamine pyrophosphate-dependent acetolactate synthase large subunit-like protein
VFAETVPNTTSFPSDHPLYQGFMARTQARRPLGLAGCGCGVYGGSRHVHHVAVHGGRSLPAWVTWVSLHVDPWEIAKNRPVEVGILGDPKATLAEIPPHAALDALTAPANRRHGSASRSSVAPRAEALQRLAERANGGGAAAAAVSPGDEQGHR